MGRTDVDRAIEELLEEGETFTSGDLVRRTGRTRQALHRHLTRWEGAGRLVREGRGRATRYLRPAAAGFERGWPTKGLAEDSVWEEVRDWLDARTERTGAADETLHYVLTELVNNAIDHSEAQRVTVAAELVGDRLELTVRDAGIGALESLRGRLGLEDHLHALQELSKGKVTTWPERPTGEGIFFSSKLVARFELIANGLAWVIDNELPDQAICEVEDAPGTEVLCALSLRSETRPEQVFAQYTHDLEFDTTRCVVRLFEHGRRFVSRSEAKRLAAGLEKFRVVILDFRGVDGVGQGFVDELFRVWARAHRDVRLLPRNMNTAVEFMVRRGLPRMDRDG